MKKFTHLHLHSEYSLLDGACSIDKIVEKAIKLGQKSVAITDHGVMYGVIDFYKKCVKAGIKPIIGCEVYVAPKTRFDRDADAKAHHLIILCKNETGYKNLINMVSLAYTEGFYKKPRIDIDLLEKHHDGLIALSACLGGKIPKLILNGEYENAKSTAIQYNKIFGDGNFYLELQCHGIEEQDIVAKDLIKISKETGIPLVATNDAHYINRENAYAQDVLMCIQMNKIISDTGKLTYKTDEFYMKSYDEMYALFKHIPQAIENTQKISDMCNLDFEFGKYHLPQFPIPNGFTANEYLQKLCMQGYESRYNTDEHIERLQFEINMIIDMGFVDYFLIVYDFIAYAKQKSISVGPGRGSAAGSIVSYCLGITDVDPIKYNLYFERFLNPERISMPDIDIDFCYVRRGEVIDYVTQKYGQDKVSQIVTFGTMAARAVIRDVGRALNIPYSDVDKIAKSIPTELGMTLEKALKVSSDFKNIYNSDISAKKLIDTAKILEGMPRHASTHAAGVVITKNPISNYVPLSKNDEAIVTQFPMTTLEELGLLKMDFLGLRNLTVISDAEKMIKLIDENFSIANIPDDDYETFSALSLGKTVGVFQLESSGVTNVISALKPQNIEDITAVISLYRPGPMQSIPRYIESKHNPQKVTFKHPLLKDILDVTYGCMVYQEQVMEVFRKLAGYSLGRADMVRRAMSKKKLKELELERKTFIYGGDGIIGCSENGVSHEIASEIFDEILDFANYAFNKAHAVSYAIISYQTAYLKTHFPHQYMAALLTSVLDIPNKVALYSAECVSLGMKITPPNINISYEVFSVFGENITFGLAAIKNVGRLVVKKIISEREENGDYKSLENFCIRVPEVNKRALECLIKSGCFDGFNISRRAMLDVYTDILDNVSLTRKKNIDGQMNLFSDNESMQNDNEIVYPNIAEFPKSKLLIMEKEITGLYLSGHPLDEYTNMLSKINKTNIYDIVCEDSIIKDGDNITVVGAVLHNKILTTKKNQTMSFCTIEDLTSSMEIVVFPKILLACSQHILENNIIIIQGTISIREDEDTKILANHITLCTQSEIDALSKDKKNVVASDYTKSEDYYNHESFEISEPFEISKTLYLCIEDDDKMLATREIIDFYIGGDLPIVLHMAKSGKNLRAPRDLWLKYDDDILNQFRDVLGHENVKMK